MKQLMNKTLLLGLLACIACVGAMAEHHAKKKAHKPHATHDMKKKAHDAGSHQKEKMMEHADDHAHDKDGAHH